MSIFAHPVVFACLAAMLTFFGVAVVEWLGYYRFSASGWREIYLMLVAAAVTAAVAELILWWRKRRRDKMLVAAIDVGTSKVVVIIGEAIDENSIQVFGVGMTVSEGAFRGEVKDPAELRDAIKVAVQKAEHVAGRKIKAAYLGGVPALGVRELVKGLGVGVNDFVPVYSASAMAVLRDEESVVVVDIGHSNTNIVVFKSGVQVRAATLPVGGWQFSNDLSVGLIPRVPFEVAEEIKKKYGSLLEVPQDKESDSSKIDSASVGLDDGREILVKDVNDLIRARAKELLRMIRLEIPRETAAPAGVVLTGGTANLPGIEVLASKVFGLPVRVGVPKDVYGLADILYDPTYATAVGLLMWGVQKHAFEQGFGRSVNHWYRRPVSKYRRSVSNFSRARRWLGKKIGGE